MRKLICVLFVMASAVLAQTAPVPAKAKTLTRAELDQLLSTPEKVLLIDVRRPDEISTNGGFPVYLSIQIADLEKHLDAIPRDRVIVTVSNHAARGGRAADLLAAHGFNVAGAVGAETYEKDGGTLVRVQAPVKKVETGEK